ncbi:FecR family protein [Peristeroidobacter agariperforans]|uniref:FecR family protein n=1 Tax=Peristeroidobacter agariperforans TaxID=268404 RepID=UPI001E2B0498
MSRHDRKLLLAWLKQSPEHVAEILRISKLDGKCCRQRLREAVKGLNESNVVEVDFGGAAQYDYQPSRTVSDKVKRKEGAKLPWKVAAAVVTMVGTAWLGDAVFDRSNGVFETVASEWKHRSLDDGSSIHLDARTQLKVEFTDTQRIVYLNHGQAAFDVAKDSRRPFIVRTPLADIIAVGTRFSVDIDLDAGVTTIVEEGVVKVIKHGETDSTAVMLAHNEQLYVAPRAVAETSLPVSEQNKVYVDAKAELEWTTGWVHFDEGATVREMVKQFNRRHEVQVSIVDPAVAEKKVRYARMRIDSVENFRDAMENQKGVAVSEDREHKMLQLRSE